MDTRTKIISAERADQVVSELRADGKQTAVATGWFDILRAAHGESLKDAGSRGSPLLALVHADSDTHPTVLDQHSRAQLVAALDAVDYVVICDQAAARKLISAWKPSAVVDADKPVSGSVIEDVLQRYSRA